MPHINPTPLESSDSGLDAMSRFAPQRTAQRAAWAGQSRAAAPHLLPWDLQLPWPEGLVTDQQEDLGEALVMGQFGNLESRYAASPTRKEAFEIMTRLGLRVIEHGALGEVPDDWEDVVVYTSVYGGHVGQDKLKLSLNEARAQFPPETLCSRFRVVDPSPWGEAVQGWSTRQYVCGDFTIRGRYGTREWRSNVGVVRMAWDDAFAPRPPGGPFGQEHEALSGPLFAVDLITCGGLEYAVDFNLCPGCTNAPTHTLPGLSIMGAVQSWSGWTRLQPPEPTRQKGAD